MFYAVFHKVLRRKFSLTNNKNEGKGFQAFSQLWLNKPPLVLTNEILSVPDFPNCPNPSRFKFDWPVCKWIQKWILVHSINAAIHEILWCLYDCVCWFEYSLCVKIFSFWLFSCLRSRFSFTSNENGSTLLRDWLRRRPTLNDLGRHHFALDLQHQENALD